jgi:tetratricopeptide (TPR) repeat protein
MLAGMHTHPRMRRLAAAVAAIEAGSYADAETQCRALLAGTQDADAALLLGMALAGQGRPGEAAEWLDHVDSLRPGGAAILEAGRMLARGGRGADVAPLYAAALSLRPDNTALAFGCINDLHDFGQADAALALLTPVRDRLPDTLALRVLTAILLADLDRLQDAVAALEDAVIRAPDQAPIWTNLGMLYSRLGRTEAAHRADDRAVALAPDHPQIRLNRAVGRLRDGRFAEAWGDYEWRLRQPGGTKLPVATLLPTLDGAPDALAGRTILVWHEEGYGDTLHFIRYVPMLAARGARVEAWLPPSMVRLLASTPGLSGVWTDGNALPPYDWHCPVFSLPRAFGTTLETIPADVPYLRVDPALVADWAARLPAAAPGELRVGLVWAGQARPWVPGFTLVDARRSMQLADLAPLGAVPGLRLISLQKGPAAGQTPPAGIALHDPMPAVTDFADTGAIVANLDAVVSVDTSVAHLAGGLAKPVLLLDRIDPCWRWLRDRVDSPWYPTMRIFRQQQAGDWAPVVSAAAAALAAMRSAALG